MVSRPRKATRSTRSSPGTRTARPATEKDPVSAYAWDVLHGKVPACRLVKLACERHERDLAAGAKRGLIWHPEAALFAIRYFGFLCHSKGEWGGQRVELAPWQEFVVGSVFGWKRIDGTRRFRVVYEEVPRKNGKSTKLAGVGLY